MTNVEHEDASIQAVAAVIGGAEALVVTAGVGMGGESGQPDFRGAAGVWKTHPPRRPSSAYEWATATRVGWIWATMLAASPIA